LGNEDLPPLEFDGEFDGYDAFNSREFWERVRRIDRERGGERSADRPADYNKGEPDSSEK